MKQRRCILVTGTILPNVPDLVQANVEARRQEYLAAMQFYRDQLDLPIYYLENSSYDLNSDPEFQGLFSSGVELMKIPPSGHPELGKGYQELAVHPFGLIFPNAAPG